VGRIFHRKGRIIVSRFVKTDRIAPLGKATVADVIKKRDPSIFTTKERNAFL